jgi:hypothetical protein
MGAFCIEAGSRIRCGVEEGRPTANEGGGMRKRIALWSAGALVAAVLALPGAASAADESFCTSVWLGSGSDCRASNQHWLYAVEGSVANSGNYRICAASAASYTGPMNSNWVCDYVYVMKLLNGNVYGVGAVHNGGPYTFQLYTGVQTWF